MASSLIVRPLAAADIEDAAQWYDAERQDLAERFLSDIKHTFERIQERPLQFPSVGRETRRALLHTFPYAVYFRRQELSITILAVLHLRRNPAIWKRRARVATRTAKPT